MRFSEEGFEHWFRDRHALGFQTWQRLFRRGKSRKGQACNGDTGNSALSPDAAGSCVNSSLLVPALAASPASIETATAGSIGQLADPVQKRTNLFSSSPPPIAALTAAERNPSHAAAEPAISSAFAVLNTAPSANLTTDALSAARIVAAVGGPAPLEYLPIAMPNPALCCGTCGYINCPTQLLAQTTGERAAIERPVAGQMPGSGVDFVPTRQDGTFGSSMSDPMSLRNVAPWQTGTGSCPEAARPAAAR